MEARLEQLLKAEGLTSAKFAEILSVQPSSISHLLSGRNKPNFDFISRLITMFPTVNPKWFINGDGDMYIDGQNPRFNNVQNEVKIDDECDYKCNTIQHKDTSNRLDAHSNQQINSQITTVTDVINTERSQSLFASENSGFTNVNECSYLPIPEVSTQNPQSDATAFACPETNPQSAKAYCSSPAAASSSNCSIQPSEEQKPQISTSLDERIKKKKLIKVLFFYDDDTFDVFDK